MEGSSVEIVLHVQTTGSLVENHSKDIHSIRAGSLEELELNLRHCNADYLKFKYRQLVVIIRSSDIKRDS